MVATLLMRQSNIFLIPRSAEFFGFSANETGGHMGRSMMLNEIRLLLAGIPEDADQGRYRTAILDENILGKPTYSSREKSLKYLLQLYGLDPQKALFRNLRKLAAHDTESLPLVALVISYCRDAQLRHSYELMEKLSPGNVLEPKKMQAWLEEGYPSRFSEVMKTSLARNVATTWTYAGHLQGRQIKKRSLPQPRPTASTYAMFAGYLLGMRGETLLGSVFGRLVGAQPSQLIAHLEWAGSMGWLRMRRGGGVMEIDFSPILTPQELERLNESV
jgi:hypothetical protein